MFTATRWKAKQRRWRWEYILILALGWIVLWGGAVWIVSFALLPTPHASKMFLRRPPFIENESPCPVYGCPAYPLDIGDIAVQVALQTTRDTHGANPWATQRSALITRQSNEHSFNQDQAVVYNPFHTQQSSSKESFLVALFDGHGHDGHVVAGNAAGMLPAVLARKLNERPCCSYADDDIWIRKLLNETFLEVNQELPPFAALRGGCTAAVALRLGSKLYVANVGDSRIILVQESSQTTSAAATKFRIPYLSRRDKANLPEERARIEKLGGKIHIPPHNPNGSRVIVYSAAAKPPEAIGLAMSRSLGDWEWKAVGVTAEPVMDVIDLHQYPNVFLLAASDGIWDMRCPEFFAQRFHDRLASDGPFQTVVDIVRDVSPAQKEWYRDDMTLVYMAID